MEDLIQRYYPTIENWGENKGTDIVGNMFFHLDGAPIFMQFYFDGVTQIQDFQKRLETENEGNLNLYVGRTKMWQAIPDIYGKEQVDKIQIAIKAPIQEQLDEWDRENDTKKIALPFENANLKKFRENYEYFEDIDQNYEKIIFERNRKLEFEQIRNSRYWKGSQESLQDHSHHDEHH